MLEPVTFEESPFVFRKSSSPKKRILIVDDDESILQSLSQLLQLMFQGCRVATAATAEDAMTMVKIAPVDLVVTDLKLPTIDGLQLVKRLRTLSSATRFILMTAYGGEEVLHNAHESGCIAYLEKPFDIDLLLKYVEAAIHPYSDLQVELTGLSILDIVELYVRKQQDVVLSITAGTSRGLVVVDTGRVCHSEFGSLDGLEAFKELIATKTGLVTSLPYRPSHRTTLQLTLKELSQLGSGIEPKSRAVNVHANGELERKKKTDLDKHWSGLNMNAPDMLRKQRVISDPTAASSAPSSEQEQLELHPQGDSVVMIKEAQVKKLVQDGIAHFKAQNFNEAALCWTKALRLDPGCVAAKKNLQLLERTVIEQDPMH